MEALKELKELGEILGYTGPQLQNFIKEQQLIQRNERAAIRQKEKEEREYKLKVETSKLKKEKAGALLAVEKQKPDAEIKL